MPNRKSRGHRPDKDHKPKRPRFTPKTEGQKRLVTAIDCNDIIFCTGVAGTGKAQPYYSKVLTDDGFTEIGSIKVGEKIFGSNGKLCNVVGVYPQGTKKIYRVSFSDGSFVDACGEHLWFTELTKDRQGHSNTKNEYFSKGAIRNTLEIKRTLLDYKSRSNHYIPLVKPIEFFHKECPIDPYMLGVLIGDGCLSSGSLMFSTGDQEIIDYFSKNIPKGYSIKHASNYDYRISVINKKGGPKPNPLTEKLKKLNLWGKKSDSKFIPHIYKFNSIKVRLDILRGLLDSDGTISRNEVTFSTVSEELKSDFVFLVQSLGGTAKISERQTKYTNKNGDRIDGLKSFRIRVKLPDMGQNLFMIKRKAEKYTPHKKYKPRRIIKNVEEIGEEKCFCISVDSGDSLYVTDNCILTHNTTTSVATAVEYLNDKSINIEKILITRPIVESGRKIGYLPGTYEDKIHPYLRPVLDELDMYLGTENRKRLKDHGMIEICPVELMRGRNFHNTFMILDEAQNAEYKQVKSFLTRIGCNSVAVLNGDETQTDLPTHLAGGLIEALNKIKHVEDVEHVHLDKSDVVRSGIVSKIVEFL